MLIQLPSILENTILENPATSIPEPLHLLNTILRAGKDTFELLIQSAQTKHQAIMMDIQNRDVKV